MPDEVVGEALLAEACDPQLADRAGLIIDGFPRSDAQARRCPSSVFLFASVLLHPSLSCSADHPPRRGWRRAFAMIVAASTSHECYCVTVRTLHSDASASCGAYQCVCVTRRS